MRTFVRCLALVGCVVAASPAEATTLGQGHGDVGIWYAPGQGYSLKLSNGDAWQAEPSSASIVVGSSARETIPASLATANSALTAGGSIWKLPQSATEAAVDGAPWLGIQVHGGPLAASSARVSLELIEASGPGQFVMWQDLEPNLYGLGGPGGPGFESRLDLIASPAAAFNSASPTGNQIDCWQHMHTHVNWGFTAPGEYEITLGLSGETAEDGAFSDVATFRFLVEGGTLVTPLLGDLSGDGVVDRADVARLSQAFGATSGATLAGGDLDGDGRVGLRDLIRLRSALGSIAGPSTTDPSSTTLPPLGSDAGDGTLLGPTTEFGFLASEGGVAPAAVPEPGSLALAGCGMLAMAWLGRRRKRA